MTMTSTLPHPHLFEVHGPEGEHPMIVSQQAAKALETVPDSKLIIEPIAVGSRAIYSTVSIENI